MDHKGSDKGLAQKGTPQKLEVAKRASKGPLTLISSPPKTGEEAAKHVGLVDLYWDDTSGRSVKRSRRDSLPEEPMSRDAETLKRNKIREIVQKIDKESRTLSKLVTDNPNTKKEIKESVKALRSLASQINTNEMQALTCPCRGTSGDRVNGAMEEELAILREELRVIKENQGKEALTKCSGCREASKKEIKDREAARHITARFGEGTDLEEFKRLIKEEWPERVYIQTKTELGTANRAKKGSDSFRIIDTEYRPLDTHNGREMVELKGQGLKPGGLGMKVLITETPREEGETIRTEKHLYFGMVGEGETDRESQVHEALMKLKRVARNKGRKSLAVEIPIMGEGRARKLVEYTMCGLDGDITVLTSRPGTTEKEGTQERKRTNQRAAVIVEAEGRTYAELLREVKAKAGGDLEETNISQVRKNAAGQLEIRVRTEREAQDVREKIMRTTEATATVKQRSTVINIRDMETETTKEEIVEALTRTCGTSGGFEVTSIRPGYEGTTTASVRVPNKWVQTLTGLGRIRIGLVKCRVKEREEVPTCPRCWKRGHAIRDCKGPDYTKRCRRCGKEGHYAASCTREIPACIECGQEGHRTGNIRCPKNEGQPGQAEKPFRGTRGAPKDQGAQTQRHGTATGEEEVQGPTAQRK